MHIPDGFLTPAVSTAALAIAVIGVGISSSKLKGNKEDFIKMGLVGGCIFAAQMLNFPILGGTSGHLIGGALAAAVLGPSAAVLVMTAILILQAVLFHDGGIFALGANIVTMGIIAPLAGASIVAVAKRLLPGKSLSLAAIPAGLISVLSAALATGLLLAASGTVPLSTVIPAMLGWHLWIGLAEGVATLVIFMLIERLNPKLSINSLTLILLVLAPFASSLPDGLERVALDLGFMSSEYSIWEGGPMIGYNIRVFGESSFSTLLAGLAGSTIIVLAFSLFRKKKMN